MPSTFTIAGTLADFGLNSMSGKSPVLEFIPSGPAFAGGGFVLPPEKVRVTPAGDGSFTVELTITEGLVPDAWYELQVRWSGNKGFTRFPGKLRVPLTGTTFARMLQTSQASAYWVISDELQPPVAAFHRVDPITGDVFPWIED
jgi:hypothetical protein